MLHNVTLGEFLQSYNILRLPDSSLKKMYLSNPYFTPDVTGKPLTNRNISYIKVFSICPLPWATDGNRTHDLSATRHTTATATPRDEDNQLPYRSVVKVSVPLLLKCVSLA